MWFSPAFVGMVEYLRAAMATEPHKSISGILVEAETTGSQFIMTNINYFNLGSYLYVNQ